MPRESGVFWCWRYALTLVYGNDKIYLIDRQRREVSNMPENETCSWCTTEVPDEELIEISDGARICTECYDRELCS